MNQSLCLRPEPFYIYAHENSKASASDSLDSGLNEPLMAVDGDENTFW